ncbi:Isochorismatase [Burkholderia diffusa]|uniref:cysteine hydrolase family protein n=1 Tax=Burkholderia diffusa TaxID=488732 RepID=UPI001CAB4B4E|nr:isochorismatase family protein [Burkholderia diffusa]CAG9244282.1 Isochorismatase [Burkholderia diffusa]
MNHPTLRHMLGATQPDALTARTTALLVIDFQDEYFTGALPIPNGAEALRNGVSLVEHADRHGWHVVHVMHVAPENAPIFAIDGPYVGIHRDIRPQPAHRLVEKESVSVFASTDLAASLKRDGVTQLVICGLMTHACVAGAARDAVPAGFDVIVAADACATRDITVDARLQVSHDALHRAALAEIADTFGTVMNTSDILSLANH